jgi:hypothetical protein
MYTTAPLLVVTSCQSNSSSTLASSTSTSRGGRFVTATPPFTFWTRNEPQKEKRNVCKRCICICRTQYIIAKSIFFFSHTWVFHVIKLSCHQTRRCRIRSSADCETRFTYVVSFCIGMKYYFNVYACVSSLNKYSARIIQLIHGQSVSSIRTTALPGRHSRWRETKRVLCVQRVRLFTGC